MASHPDDLYGSLLKLSEYVETELQHWNSEDGLARSERFRRVFFWHPILVVGGDLLLAKVDREGQVSLEATATAFLEFNWHAGDMPQTTLIEFISASSLQERLIELVKYDAGLEHKAHQLFLQSR